VVEDRRTEEQLRANSVSLAVLQNDVKHLTETVEILSKQVAAINNTLAQAAGGWRTLMAIAGAAGSIGAALSYLASHVFIPPKV